MMSVIFQNFQKLPRQNFQKKLLIKLPTLSFWTKSNSNVLSSFNLCNLIDPATLQKKWKLLFCECNLIECQTRKTFLSENCSEDCTICKDFAGKKNETSKIKLWCEDFRRLIKTNRYWVECLFSVARKLLISWLEGTTFIWWWFNMKGKAIERMPGALILTFVSFANSWRMWARAWIVFRVRRRRKLGKLTGVFVGTENTENGNFFSFPYRIFLSSLFIFPDMRQNLINIWQKHWSRIKKATQSEYWRQSQ